MTSFTLRQDAATFLQTGTMSGSAADTADTTPPIIIDRPRDGEAADTDLVLTFSEAVQAGTGKLTLSSGGHTVFSGDIATSPAIKLAGNTLTLQLDKALAHGTDYELTLDQTAIKDLAGNPLGSGAPVSIAFLSALSPTSVSLTGGDGDDVLHGSDLADTLAGGQGTNILYGHGGNDMLTSWGNGDQLYGGDGNDTLTFLLRTTGATQATAYGGAGSDKFVVADIQPGAVITIADFQSGAGGDSLDLGPIARWPFSVDSPFDTGGNLKVVQRGADTVFQADLDGSGPGGFQDVVILKNVTATTLISANLWNHFNTDGTIDGSLVTGTDGNDYLNAGFYGDTLVGGLGNDVLTDNFGKDSLDGGPGDDQLTSWYGSDTLVGGSGNDKLWVVDRDGTDHKGGTVLASGGDGDDKLGVNLTHSPGATVQLSGGAGHDTFYVDAPQTGLVTITDFQTGADGDVLDAFGGVNWKGATPFTAYYKIVQRGADAVLEYDADGTGSAATFHDLVILKNVDASTLVPGNLAGYRQDGSVTGKLIEGTPAADTLSDTPLNDAIHGGDGNDVISAGKGDDLIDGGAGNDTLDGGQGNDTVIGGDGDDKIQLTFGGNDQALGGNGNDFLSAYYSGSDTLDGGAGNDFLWINHAESGAKIVMIGGTGDDSFEVTGTSAVGATVTATGGAGRDVFSAWSNDVYTVTDFQTGANGDQIYTGLPTNELADAFSKGYLRLRQDGSNTLLEYDPDGKAGPAGFSTHLVLLNTVATKFTAANFEQGIDLHSGTTPTPSPAPTPAPTPVPTPAPTPTPTPVPSTPGETHTGSTGTDQLTGTAGNDTLDGGDGNDVLHGGAGNDVLIGGTGRDTASYDGKAADYKITHDADGWHVADQRSGGTDGTDTLQGVERVTFADTTVALDTDGAAGQAYRFYRAAFDRTPDLPGLGFWIGAMDKGSSVQDLAAGFSTSKEFNDMYGGASNADIVSRLYHNVLHRTPEQAGYDYWLHVLDNKQASLSDVLAAFSESAENKDAVADLIANGILFTPWHG
jgi:Ca2+-binding RTX toxin-like protein